VDCGWSRQRAHYLPNFVNETTAPPLPRSELFTPQGAPLIFALGRLHRNKAFDVLLAALSRVPNVYLWLAGDGPLRRDLEEEAMRLGVKPRVRFLGWRDDVAALFAAADVFVCPSRFEPLGNVVVEAWAQSRPVIAADSLGPGTLIHDMETGVLVPVDDAPSMARAIELVLGDEQLRGHIARQGREAFEAAFTEEAVVEQYMEFFDAVMAAHEAEKKRRGRRLMCGIAGIMTIDGGPPDGHALDGLEKALAHRGPDGSGRHISGGVGMVQTRLAVIDIETGGQPLYADKPGGGKAALVANGEIYNYIELKASMPGVPFATNSDCEPPLHLYLRHGLDFSSRLSGMYAIAIHDQDQSGGPSGGRLVLVRDPFGIKPLYYSETAAGFVFASEPQALIRAGLVEARLNEGARDEVLQLQYTCGRRCAFQGIERLLPGETMVVERGRITHRHRRPALPEGETSISHGPKR